MHAHSDGVGAGSKFTVCLPRVISRQEQRVDSESPKQATTSSLRVLIVDDNVDAASMLAMFLESFGYNVVVENDACAALAQAAKFCPHVCLLDIGLPGMDGYELARRLRSVPQAAQAMLIAVTGYGQPQDKEKSFLYGFDYHFVKPMDTAHLHNLLTEISERAARD